MGRKKPIARDEENGAVGGAGGKSKKKPFVIDDDEYAMGTEVSEELTVEEEKVAPAGNKKKGKKGGSKRTEVKDEDDDAEDDKFEVQEEEEEDDPPVVKFVGKKKGKGKKGGSASVFSTSNFGLLGEEEEEDGDHDEREDEVEDVEELSEDVPVKTTQSKKSSSGFSSAFDLLDQEEDKQDKDETKEEDDDIVISFSDKKKKKSSKGLKKASANSFSAALLDEENYDNASVLRSVNDVVGGDEDRDEDVLAIKFSGKKKPSKKKNISTYSAMETGNGDASSDLIEPDQPIVVDDSRNTEQIIEDVVETSKNKKKKKKGGKTGQEEEDLDKILAELGGNPIESKYPPTPVADPAAPQSGKKVQKQPEIEEAAGYKEYKEEGLVDSKSTKQISEDVAETSKNKKKKKKGGKTGQEEEDLEKIIAELGGAPPVSKSSPTSVADQFAPQSGENIQKQPEIQEAAGDNEGEEEGPVESAASKKKKKKKEKEKKTAASTSSTAMEEKQEEMKIDTKSKVLDNKKVPKHVREMQERLAKLKEAEEKKKRDEEERLRKEEEERRRQEELERLAEEKKRLKKEREKEKLLKKKQEGKLLTGKQKEEARRLEAMRKQILANAALQLPAGETAGAPAKRPLYQKKKSKPQAQINGAAPGEAESTDSKDIQQELASEVDSMEANIIEELELSGDKDKCEPTDVVQENGINEEEEEEEEEEDDEEWDAKSWDDADLKLPGKSAFADEEAESEPEPLVKKEIRSAQISTQDFELPCVAPKLVGVLDKDASTIPLKSQSLEVKKKDSDADGSDKKMKKASVITDKKDKKVAIEETQKSDGSFQIVQDLRSPICCIMGHVDTGKTKLLDCIRGTNVQEGEAGGITQQIGATYFPAENIRERTRELKADAKLNVPGLLVIDTPGHESFTNLRSRGSGLCDIAILVVDIMHGLEPQTIESLNLLKMRNTEFIVALNKVDRLYGWKTCRNAPIRKAMNQQSKDVQIEFNMRLTEVITMFKEQGLNTELYWKNKEMGQTFSIVPTSAISGEGIPDLLLLLVNWTQKTMIERLTFSNEVECTVLEVKVVEGHGTTIDVVLVNGVLHEGDQIVVCGLQGPIVTTIRALLTPHPMKELRVKGTYLHHKEIKAAQGIKITGQGLEHAIAGTSLYVVGPDDDLEDVKEAAMEDMKSVMSRIDKSGEGVYVQASTLGSLEALLEFLKTPAVNIPVSGISIGPVHKRDVMRASVMLEKKKEYGTILAFDVKVTPEARELADESGVKIFIADIIYHLFDQFKAYIDNIKEEKKKEAAEEAVFPCVLKIMPNCVFNKKDPIVLGVDVLEGIAKVGTPLCIPQKEYIDIGKIASIENNHKPVEYAKKGQKVAIKIIGSNPEEQQKMFGRHFEMEDELVSRISRNSLDALKLHYAEDLSAEDKRLLFRLKRLFQIP